jgi:hypothetical protein
MTDEPVQLSADILRAAISAALLDRVTQDQLAFIMLDATDLLLNFGFGEDEIGEALGHFADEMRLDRLALAASMATHWREAHETGRSIN